MIRTLTVLIPLGAEPEPDRFSEECPWLPVSYAGAMRTSQISPDVVHVVLWMRRIPEDALEVVNADAQQKADNVSRLVT